MKPGLRGVLGNFAEFTHPGAGQTSSASAAPRSVPVRPGIERVLVLGDSFTVRHGLSRSRTPSRRRAAELTRRGLSAEGINAGIGGYGVPDEGWLALVSGSTAGRSTLASSCSAFFTGNDLQDAAPDRPPPPSSRTASCWTRPS